MPEGRINVTSLRTVTRLSSYFVSSGLALLSGVALVAGAVTAPPLSAGRTDAIAIIHTNGTTTLYLPTAQTNAARGDALVTAFAAHVDGDEIRVGAGEYDVPCGTLLLKDARLTGTPDTLVRAKTNTATHPRGDAIVSSLSPAQKKHCQVRGIRFDCNLQNQNYPAAVVAAVSLLGGGSIEDCSAINWGSKGVENFVFIIGCQPGNGGLHAPKILRCVIDTPAPIVNGQVVTAFDIWADVRGARVTRDWVRRAEIAYCVANNITTGAAVGQPMAFHMITPGSWASGSIHHNLAWNLRGGGVDPYKDNTFIYQDSFGGSNVALFGNTGLNICQGIYIGVNDATLTFDHWRISRNHLTINSTGNRLGITQSFGARFSGWEITRNYVSSPAGHALFLDSGSRYNISGNTFEGVIGTGSATITKWRNNRRPNGTILSRPAED